jgi:hypothetical protein
MAVKVFFWYGMAAQNPKYTLILFNFWGFPLNQISCDKKLALIIKMATVPLTFPKRMALLV